MCIRDRLDGPVNGTFGKANLVGDNGGRESVFCDAQIGKPKRLHGV